MSKAVDVYGFGVLLWEVSPCNTDASSADIAFVTKRCVFQGTDAHCSNLAFGKVGTGDTCCDRFTRPLCMRPIACVAERVLVCRRARTRGACMQLYVGERPWAGLRPVQIILKKTTAHANLAFPPGTPAAYKVPSPVDPPDIMTELFRSDPTETRGWCHLVGQQGCLTAECDAR